MKSNQRVLAVFIEPTPYILGFLQELEANWAGTIDVVFLKENYTQDWDVTMPASYTILSSALIKTVGYLVRQISKNKYSMIHIAGWSNPVCFYLLFWARIKRTPISVESDTQFNPYTRVWKKLLKRFLYPTLFALPTIFMPGGTRQFNYLKHYGVPTDKIVVAQMTVDVKNLKRQTYSINEIERLAFREKHGAQNHDVVFLFVGRLIKCKKLDDLINAFQALQSQPAKLWIVGSGDQEDYISICAQSIPGIHYFGRESGERLTRLYDAADVFVLPSLVEQWGLVVNEAMATGNALIVSEQVGCVDDLIIHEKTGLLFPPTDISALVIAMKRMILETEFRERLAIQAKEHISVWTLENLARNVVRAWESMLETDKLPGVSS